jgi:hypothetical protein
MTFETCEDIHFMSEPRGENAYLREALDDLFKKYASTLRKASK